MEPLPITHIIHETREPLPITHIIHETREPVTALSQPHRHNGGTRLVVDRRGRVFRHDERELVPVGLRS